MATVVGKLGGDLGMAVQLGAAAWAAGMVAPRVAVLVGGVAEVKGIAAAAMVEAHLEVLGAWLGNR